MGFLGWIYNHHYRGGMREGKRPLVSLRYLWSEVIAKIVQLLNQCLCTYVFKRRYSQNIPYLGVLGPLGPPNSKCSVGFNQKLVVAWHVVGG